MSTVAGAFDNKTRDFKTNGNPSIMEFKRYNMYYAMKFW